MLIKLPLIRRLLSVGLGSGVIKPAELALLTALGSGGQGRGWRSGGGGGVCWRGERLRLLRLRRAGGFVDPLPHVGSLDYRPPSQFPCHGDCLRRDSLTLFSTTLGSFITCAMVARNMELINREVYKFILQPTKATCQLELRVRRQCRGVLVG